MKKKKEDKGEKSDFEMFKSEIAAMFMELKNTLQEIEIIDRRYFFFFKNSITTGIYRFHLSIYRYDEIIEKIRIIKGSRTADSNYIRRRLEDKIEHLALK